MMRCLDCEVVKADLHIEELRIGRPPSMSTINNSIKVLREHLCFIEALATACRAPAVIAVFDVLVIDLAHNFVRMGTAPCRPQYPLLPVRGLVFRMNGITLPVSDALWILVRPACISHSTRTSSSISQDNGEATVDISSHVFPIDRASEATVFYYAVYW